MFLRRNRFIGSTDIKRLLRSGNSTRSRAYQLKHKETQQPTRYAVIVSKKVEKRAVKRNKIRRRVYEALRDSHPTHKEGHDIAITIYSVSVLDDDFTTVKKDITTLLTKAKIIPS